MTKTSLILMVIVIFTALGIIGYAITILLKGEVISAFSILGTCIILYAILEPVIKRYLKVK